MRLNVDQIPDAGLTLKQTISQDVFGTEFPDGVLSRPLTVSLKASRTDEKVWVKGVLAGELRLTCSRCTKVFHQEFRIPFSTLYVSHLSERENCVEVTAEQDSPDYAQFDGDAIELLEDMKQNIMLELPISPICQEACRGLCPKCGADLNLGQCGCREEPEDSPFAKLKELKQKLPEG